MDREQTSNHIVLEVQWNVDENVIYTVLFFVLQEGWGELKMNIFSRVPIFFFYICFFLSPFSTFQRWCLFKNNEC